MKAVVRSYLRSGLRPSTACRNANVRASTLSLPTGSLVNTRTMHYAGGNSGFAADVAAASESGTTASHLGRKKEAKNLKRTSQTKGVDPERGPNNRPWPTTLSGYTKTLSILLNQSVPKGISKRDSSCNFKMREANRVLDKIREVGMLKHLPLRTWNHVISTYCKRGDTVWAMNAYTEMKKHQKPDSFTYVALLSVAGHARADAHVSAVIGDMLESGIELDLRAITTIMNTYFLQGNVEGVMELFQRCGEDGTLDAPIFNVVMKTLTKAGRFKECDTVYKSMLNHGIEPNETTYFMRFRALQKQNLFNKSLELFEEMVTRHIPIKPGFYTDLVGFIYKKKGIQYADMFLDAHADIKPDELLFYRLLCLAKNLNRPDDVEVIRYRAEALGIKPNTNFFFEAVDTYLRANQLLEAAQVLDKMQEMEVRWTYRLCNLFLDCTYNDPEGRIARKQVVLRDLSDYMENSDKYYQDHDERVHTARVHFYYHEARRISPEFYTHFGEFLGDLRAHALSPDCKVTMPVGQNYHHPKRTGVLSKPDHRRF